MPARNSLKQYLENSYYHVYNRGVEKRLIFQDQQDYTVFLSYLKDYLLPKDEQDLEHRLSDLNLSYKERDKVLKLLRLNNFYGEIVLLAYCLMPNHFHFFIKQTGAESMDKFMNSLGTRYTMYLNRKYKRVGTLYQGVYKAVLVENEQQFIYLSKYIHKQALGHHPSSLPEYLGQRKTQWIYPEEVLAYFSKTNPQLTYEAFIEESESFDFAKDILLEDS